MSGVRKVAVAGAGRIGGPVVDELIRAGYEVTVLTRNAANPSNKYSQARIVEVDYDSDTSLINALEGQEAVVSTVAMSAINNQPRMIDAAITAGVKLFVPAEYTVNSRDANAQAQPMMAMVVAIQRYLASKEDKIDWFVINCGALLEFSLDHPLLLDFDNRTARLWDGGEGAISLSDTPLLARAVAAILSQPDRVIDHRLKIHGGTITQNHALGLARKYSSQDWKIEHVKSQEAYSAAMQRIRSGATDEPADVMANLMTAYGAAAFGNCDGHLEAAYAAPDNERLGVKMFENNEIEEAIRRRITVGTWAAQSATTDVESVRDVTGDLAAAFRRA